MGISRSKNTGDKAQRLEFWKQFRAYAIAHSTKLNLLKPSPPYLTRIEVGDKEDWIELGIFKNNLVKGDPDVDEDRWTGLAVRIYVKYDRVTLFEFLKKRKKEIEKALGYEKEGIVWKKYEKIQHPVQAERSYDWINTDEWEEGFEWLLRTGEKFQDVFPKYLKQYYDQGGE